MSLAYISPLFTQEGMFCRDRDPRHNICETSAVMEGCGKGFVKWKGIQSEIKYIPGGGLQCGMFEILGFLSQSNDLTDIVDEEEKFNLLMI